MYMYIVVYAPSNVHNVHMNTQTLRKREREKERQSHTKQHNTTQSPETTFSKEKVALRWDLTHASCFLGVLLIYMYMYMYMHINMCIQHFQCTRTHVHVHVHDALTSLLRFPIVSRTAMRVATPASSLLAPQDK